MNTSKAARRSSVTTSARRRARQAALTGLYQWLISNDDPTLIQVHVEEQEVHAGCDRVHFEALLHGCIGQANELDIDLGRHVDRPTADLSPVEHAALMIGAYELRHCLEIPYRVVINEAVELTKTFGGTDGHKYVNGVLDKTAAELRSQEVLAGKAKRT
ncbi:MAG: transcription antitermination factor NusB [Betaproteobacteria bacterium]|nr:transcription antitermination factor NusB [Betaproteobacteria bacterium]